MYGAQQYLAVDGAGVYGGRGGGGGPPVEGVDGNWRCLSCSNINFGTRAVCNRCQSPRPSDVQLMQAQMEAPAVRKGGAPVEGVDGNWKCLSCTNINFASRTHCNRCQAPKPTPEQLEAAAYAPAGQRPAAFGKGGPPVEGMDGNWKCINCGNINFVQRAKCNRCQTDKALSVNPMAQMLGYDQQSFDMSQFGMNAMAQLPASLLGGDQAAAAAAMGMAAATGMGSSQELPVVLAKMEQMEQRQTQMALTVSALQQQVQNLQKQLTEQAFQLATQANVTSTLALRSKAEDGTEGGGGGTLLGKRTGDHPDDGNNPPPALR